MPVFSAGIALTEDKTQERGQSSRASALEGKEVVRKATERYLVHKARKPTNAGVLPLELIASFLEIFLGDLVKYASSGHFSFVLALDTGLRDRRLDLAPQRQTLRSAVRRERGLQNRFERSHHDLSK